MSLENSRNKNSREIITVLSKGVASGKVRHQYKISSESKLYVRLTEYLILYIEEKGVDFDIKNNVNFEEFKKLSEEVYKIPHYQKVFEFLVKGGSSRIIYNHLCCNIASTKITTDKMINMLVLILSVIDNDSISFTQKLFIEKYLNQIQCLKKSSKVSKPKKQLKVSDKRGQRQDIKKIESSLNDLAAGLDPDYVLFQYDYTYKDKMYLGIIRYMIVLKEVDYDKFVSLSSEVVKIKAIKNTIIKLLFNTSSNCSLFGNPCNKYDDSKDICDILKLIAKLTDITVEYGSENANDSTCELKRRRSSRTRAVLIL